jgi:Tol biopolymer transport system component
VATGGKTSDHKIVLIDPLSLAVSDLINLKGEFGHEYWPKDSNDGQYLVFGSSRGGGEHEHDTADYEIFLWKFGSDNTNAIRLTFHTGNDNWPDVHIFKP